MKPSSKNGNGTGNVHSNGAARKEESVSEIREGDYVQLKPAVLKMARLSTMTPRLLYQIGHPGIFQVVHVFETEEDGVCLTLGECCLYYLKDRKKSDDPRCTGHPAIYFDKVEIEATKPKNKGDRATSVQLPFGIGELAGVEYQDDEGNPKLTIRVAGKSTVFTGMLAKIFGKAAQDHHIL